MKIGVMTFWWSQDNYGQLLQCYALQKYLRDLGHDAYLIKYRMLPPRINLGQKFMKYGLHPWRIFEGFNRVKVRHRALADNSRFDRKFDEFREKHLKMGEVAYSTIEELLGNPPQADMYVTGSDQVWNIDGSFSHGDARAYFLDFGPSGAMRLAYAPSFGRRSIPEAERACIAPYLKRFAAVSCRERDGVSICKSCGIDAKWVCDPTLLLDKAAWNGLAAPIRRERGYVFVYMLANPCDFSLKELSEWARGKGLDVVYVKGNRGTVTCYSDEGFPESNPTIEQWLGYIRGAQCVVTNSFHCSLFATVFGRPFGVVPLTGRHSGANNRIMDLCGLCGNEPCILGGGDYGRILDAPPPQCPDDVGQSGRMFIEENMR